MGGRQSSVESLEVTGMDKGFWKGKKVLVTGHTGFKGAWMAATLRMLGAEVTGYSLPAPSEPSLFEQLGLAKEIKHIEGDITDRKKFIDAVKNSGAEIMFHMAAQSLVRYSYREPVETFDTNVTGTVNMLEAARHCKGLKALVIITTDKCYANDDSGRLFVEEDAMGGKDPYSASKAAAEIVTNAYYQSFLKEAGVPVASARAGNVIGGGDFSEDRLIPDIVRAYEKGDAVQIRSPKATRPWQFVLEPVGGYMEIAERLYKSGHEFAGGWNFGPEKDDIKPVEDVMAHLKEHLDFKLELDNGPHPVEAKLLALDITKAKTKLGWKPKLNLKDAVGWTGKWYKEFVGGGDVKAITEKQIREYFGI